MKIPNISLGFASKKYSHNKSRDCNTTFPFGIVQPIFTEYMLPDSDISVNAKQLVRLAPMPVPSFARVSLHTVTRFVPEHDVVPYSDAFYSKMSFRGAVPTRLPIIDNPTLVAYMLQNSLFCAYNYNSSTGKYSVQSTYPGASVLNGLFSSTNRPALDFSSNYRSSSTSPLLPVPSPESCDYLIRVIPNSSLGITFHGVLCFNFGSKAKTFRNICLGLGYSLDMDDFTKVRLSPLLSFAKAYFDTFGIKRFKNWTQTKAFSLITTCFDSDSLTYDLSFSATSTYTTLFAFFDELVECYYSVQNDFVSIHRDSLQINSLGSLTVPIANSSSATLSSYTDGSASTDPRFSVLTNQTFSLATFRALKALSHFASKNSLLGQRLSEYMRLHYGSDSVNSIFEDSNFVDNSVLPCQINDVFSTSDTAQSDGSGEHLGSFAGKGIGFGDLSFKYHSKCHGYLITLAAIVPDSGYWQGNSCDLFAVTWEQQPSSDFDAIGMEVTPRSAFISHNDISNRPSLGTADLTDKSFGFVPRFSGFKFAKNVVSGDMSRRGTIDSMSPYYLDHIIASNQAYVTKDSAGAFTLNLSSSAVPSGSYEWRYVCKYPWLGNFLRLFINDTGNLVKGTYLPTDKDTANYPYYCIDDPFICQISFDCRVRNCLKPLSLCYDTFDNESDNSSKDVSAS